MLATLFLSAALLLPSLVRSAPTPTTDAVALTDVESKLRRPALFARAAYCSSAPLTAWKCGTPCTDIGKVKFLQAGGDEGRIPLYFIAHDIATNSLVVAHQGTSSKNILSILNDAKFALVDLNATRFPQFADQGIKVHDGFQDTFERTADGLLDGVLKGLDETGATQISVTGHSLGAAIATMTGLWLKQNVDASIPVSVTGFGLPRGGNKEWADLLDSEVGVTFFTNQNDPVPTVPPLFLGFQHPSGEIHSVDDTQNSFLACPGQDNENCATGNSLLDASVANHRGPYFDDLSFGGSQCPDLDADGNPIEGDDEDED
ncbi:Lipase-3 domain-containing protein [Mycena kentingensis (nom. inval.)]|nr:Lipase-3 domain-containing protein [Mycena kentingensis (nom. inval.)]